MVATRPSFDDHCMGLVPPNHGPHPDLAVEAETSFMTTRTIEVNRDRIRGEKVVLPAGVRLSYLRTDYAAECIPPIEYADIRCSVETGRHAGSEIVLLAFEMDEPVRELPQLARRYGIVPEKRSSES
jgi:hypothetical protein